MSWGEACRLARLLTDDPTSQVAAVVRGFERPWSFEWAATADLYDLTVHANTDEKHRAKVKPYPRPWRDPNRKGRTDRTRAEVIAILNAHGHNIEEAG